MREYLKELRRISGDSQQKVASAIGMTRQNYNFIENGKRQKDIDLPLLLKLSQFFNVPLESLIEAEIVSKNKEESSCKD